MTITQELLEHIWKKALEIGNLNGYTVHGYDHVYLTMEDGPLQLVLANFWSGDYPDTYTVDITPEQLNANMEELLAAKKALEEETRRVNEAQAAERLRLGKIAREAEELAEWKRLNKKYGNK